jgi:hypothetical protein
MKKIILLLTVLAYCEFGFSQTMKIPAIVDTLTGDQFQKIINKEFNSVINSSGKTTIGNYASADVKDGHVAFNATKNFKNGNMLSFNANGGITDGFFAIFNHTKVNSNLGIDLKYNIRFKSSSISYHTDEIAKLRKKLKNADLAFTSSKTVYKLDSIFLESKINLINAEISSITQHLTEVDLSVEKKANFKYQIALKNLQKDTLLFKQQTLMTASEAEEIANNKKKKEKNSAVSDFEYTGIFFHWISFSGGFQNNNFSQFNPKFSTLDSQIIKQNFLVWNTTIEYNLYKWNQYSKPTFYWLLGVKGSIGDNFSELSKVEINDMQLYGDSINQRATTKKFYAYKGDYKTNLVSAKFYTDFYLFFLKNNAALHIYPDVIFKQKNKPLYNTGLGLVYSFKDTKDKDNKTKLHAELYFKLYDLTNNGKSDLSILDRNELGLRLSVPVSFFNF